MDQSIEATWQQLRAEHAQLRARMREIAALRDQVLILERIARLSDSEKRALAQALIADGIVSAEAFGAPGRG